MSLVLDASMTLAWIFERADPQERALADRLLDSMAGQEALVPVLWHTEVANALLVAERRGVVGKAQVIDYLHRLSRLPLVTDDVGVSARQAFLMALGREYRAFGLRRRPTSIWRCAPAPSWRPSTPNSLPRHARQVERSLT